MFPAKRNGSSWMSSWVDGDSTWDLFSWQINFDHFSIAPAALFSIRWYRSLLLAISLQNRVIICKEPTHLTLSTATTTTTTADTRLPPLYNLQFFTALCVLSRRWKLKIIIIIISIPTARVTFQLCGRKRTSSRFLICFLRPLPACLLNRSSSKLLLVQSK